MKEVKGLKNNNIDYSFSNNAKLLMKVARENQIPILKLDPEHDLFQLGYGRYSVLFKGLVTEKSSGVFSSLKRPAIINSLLDSLEIKVDNPLKVEKNYKLLVVNQQLKAVLEVGSSRKVNRLSQLTKESKELIEKLTQIYNLNLAEISVWTDDITMPVENWGEISDIEITPDLSQYRKLIDLEKMSRELIDYYAPARIPIITVVGNNHEVIVSLVDSILQKVGLKTGIAVNNVIHNQEGISQRSYNLSLLLQNKEVEIIVHGIMQQDLTEQDLPYRESELLIITELSSEQDLTFANSLLKLNELNSNLIAINIDQRSNLKLLNHCEEKEIIYCSLNPENLVLKHQIKSHQPAVFTTENNLVIFDGVDQLPVIALERLTPMIKKDSELMLGLLFTVAAAFVFEIPVFVTRSILENLTTVLSEESNRSNMPIN
ncbi:hypothetical protein [Halanaerobacter jeridensis]|uniref:Uncharacterized protein n=1 Tax=Halanaerobacter jeridensis TaxID=706427 RepID=A0A938XTF7_9FIRM|nr:hypothetical protein [Halanaerobacter jeridensis]MBM7557215.1 hypothetical protein [Halanaerobacter jeridensis]